MTRNWWFPLAKRETRSSIQGRGRFRPRYRPSVERLEERQLLSVDFSQVQKQLPGVLDNYQQAVTQQVLSKSLPLVGDSLKSAPDAKFIDDLNTQLKNKLPSQNATSDTVCTALKNALGALGLAPNVDCVMNSADDYEFKVHMAGHRSFASPFNLGLSPQVPLTATGNVKVDFDYQFELWFGVVFQNNATNLYLDTTPAPEIALKNIDVSIPKSLVSAKLKEVEITASDGAFPNQKKWTTSAGMTPSRFKNGLLTIDVTGPARVYSGDFTIPYFQNNTTIKLTGDANVNLAVELAVKNFPAFAFNLQVHWGFTQGNLDGDRPTIAFNDVQLDMGSFFSVFVNQLMDTIHAPLQAVQPIKETLTKPLPVLSNLGVKVSLYDIGKGVAQQLGVNLGFIDKFITAYDTLFDLSTVSNIPSVAPQTLIVNYGSFDLGSADPRDLKNFVLNQVSPNITATPKLAIKDQIKTSTATGHMQAYDYLYSQKGLEGSNLGKLDLPILDDAKTLFQTMLLRDNVTLFQYQMPDLDTTVGGKYHLFHFDQSFSVLGPVGVRLHGDIDAKASLAFGYDTHGLAHLGELNPIKNPNLDPNINPADGIFVSQAQVSLTGEFAADLVFSFPVFSPFVGGGVHANVDFSLRQDKNLNPSLPVRFSQLKDEFLMGGPLCTFNIGGQMYAFLEAGVKIGVELPIIGFVGVTFSFHIANFTLLDFNFDPCKQPQPKPILAQYDPPNAQEPNQPRDLVLNLGMKEKDRNYQLNATKEIFSVAHTADDNSPKGDESVDVSAFGYTQTYKHVKRIVVRGNDNDESVVIDSSVKSDAEMTSGKGNNQLTYLGIGNAKISVAGGGNNVTNVLTGGQGSNDLSVVGNSSNTLVGGSGLNKLMVQGDGDNQLTAGDNNDELSVSGNGSNLITTGGGQDKVVIAGNAAVQEMNNKWNEIVWKVGNGNLVIEASGGRNALEVGGSPHADTFVVNPYPAPNDRGVEVWANKRTITAKAFLQKVSIDGAGGANQTTVNDLGKTTDVREVAVNVVEAQAVNQANDVTYVQGAADYHTLDVTTDKVTLEKSQSGLDTHFGGIMRVRTRGPESYNVHVAVSDYSNDKDDLHVYAKGSNNTINVHSNTGHTIIHTDTGSDTFNVSSDAPTNAGVLFNEVDPPPLNFGLYGLLNLHAGAGANTLRVSGAGATMPSTIALTDSAIFGTVKNKQQGLGDPPLLPFRIQYDSTGGDWTGGLALLTGTGKDTIYVQSTPANAPVFVTTGGGGDQVVVGSDFQNPNNSTIDTIRGPLGIDGLDGTPVVSVNDQKAPAENYVFDSFFGNVLRRGNQAIGYSGLGSLVLNAGNNNNNFVVHNILGTAATINTGNGTNAVVVGDFNNQIGIDSPLTINGQNGSNTLTVNDQGSNLGMASYTLTASALQRSLTGVINYNNIKSFTVNAGSGNNFLTILSTAASTTYSLNAGAGINTLVGSNAANAWKVTGVNAGTLSGATILGPVAFSSAQNLRGGGGTNTFTLSAGAAVSGTIDGQGGTSILDLSAYSTGLTFTITAGNAGSITGIVPAFTSIQNLVGGSGDDAFVFANGASLSGTIDGRGGNNMLDASPYLSGLTFNITSSNAGNIVGVTTFSAIQNLVGGMVNNVFVFQSGAGIAGMLNGGAGSNTLDYSAYSTNVLVNLQTGRGTGVGGLANIQNVQGGTGGPAGSYNVLVGNGGNFLIGGNGRRNLLIAGSAPSALLGGNDDDILIGGTTAYDGELNFASLQAIMNYWSATSDDYATRVDKLLAGNGVPALNAATVTGNGGGNWLFGHAGSPTERNLFFGNLFLDANDADATESFIFV